MPDARDCAELLLDTVPNLMRGLWTSVYPKKCSPEDAPNRHQLMSQYRLLAILQAKERTLGELAALHRVTPSTMSRSVDVLVRRAWVDRANDARDRRQVILRLTDEGLTAHHTMIDQMHDSVAHMIEQLDAGDIAQLYAGLEVLKKLTTQVQQRSSDDAQSNGEER